MSNVTAPGDNESGLPTVDTLTGNSGGAVGADSNNNINIVGSGSVDVVGNPSTNTLTISVTGVPLSVAVAASSTQACAVNTVYYVTAASGCVLTLPATAAAGSIVGVVGNGAGGWTLEPNTGQTIKVLTASASTSVASGEQYDCISVMCTVANTTWVMMNCVTTGFTVT